MKTLKTKPKYLARVYYFLKNYPPAKVQTIDDIRRIWSILSSTEELVSDFIKVQNKITEIGDKVRRKEITEAEGNKILETVTNEMIELNNKDNIAELQLDNDDFNTLFNLVNPEIKTIFVTIEDVISFDKSLNEANRQPKEKKEEEKKEEKENGSEKK